MLKKIVLYMLLVFMSVPSVSMAAIKYGPYLSQVTTGSVVMTWITDTDTADNKTIWGLTESLGTETAQSASEYNDGFRLYSHIVSITGLLADTVYHYKVYSDGDESAVYTFETAVNSGDPFSFSFIADSRDGHHVFAHFINDMIKRGVKFNINGGDTVHTGGIFDQWQLNLFGIANSDAGGPYYLAGNFMATHPMFYVFADHESYGKVTADHSGNDKVAFFFTPPDNGLAPTAQQQSYYYKEYTYAFAYGNVYFISLASCEDQSGITAADQKTWLEQQLVIGAGYDYRVVMFHEACYNVIWYCNTEAQDQWAPLFEQYNVNVVFMGNSHAFNDTVRNGVHYITAGGGGAELEYADAHPELADQYGFQVMKTAAIWHYVIVDVSSSYMLAKALDVDGNVFHSILWGEDPGTGTGSGTATGTGSGTDTTSKCRFTTGAFIPAIAGMTAFLAFFAKKRSNGFGKTG